MIERIAVLVSGSGSNLQALLDRPVLAERIAVVVSDRGGVRALERAEAAGVQTAVVPPSAHADRPAWDQAMLDEVAHHGAGAVVLAGFMRILAAPFVTRWPVVNVHPSLLPAFPGAHAVEEALAWGVKLTGCTVHLVDEEVDHGPVIAQEAVVVRDDDDAASLHQRIQAVEHRLLPDCVEALCAGRLVIDGRRVRVVPPVDPTGEAPS